MPSIAFLGLSAAVACAVLERATLAGGVAHAACSAQGGQCDDDDLATLSLLQRQKQRSSASSLKASSLEAAGTRSGSGCSYFDKLKELTKPHGEPQTNPDGGSFRVWKFPLSFDNYTMYWRRFSVDLPKNPEKACGKKGCPILVAIPGSMGSVYSHRYWSKWIEHQKATKSKFILVTVEGSPDAVTYADQVVIDDPESYWSATSWNILGWGKATDLGTDAADTCTRTSGDKLLVGCFDKAANKANAYQCFGTQQAKDPRGCKLNPDEKALYPMITTACASTSAANDWDYMKHVLGFVVNSSACRSGGWCGNRERIYLSGQSMGGMGALQFATPDPTSDYFLGETCDGNLRPSAVVGCSVGGSRNNDLDLKGQVPALVIQGSRDEIAPATPMAGYLRVPKPQAAQLDSNSEASKFVWVPYQKKMIGANDADFVLDAISYLDLELDMPNDDAERVNLLLQADAQVGGALLVKRRPADVEPGCPAKAAGATAIAGDYYMWETLNTTVQRVVGLGSRHPVNMSTLTYTTTQYPAASREDAEKERFQCTDVSQVAGLSKEVRICVFDGGHTYPFLSKTPEVLHEYIWENFLQGGTLT